MLVPRIHDQLDTSNLIAYATYNHGTAVNSAWISVADFTDIAFFIYTGTLTDTLTVKIQYASDNSGTGATDAYLNPSNATSLTVPATFDNTTGRVSIRPRSIPSGNVWVRLVVTPNTANAPFGAYYIAQGEHRVPSMTATALLTGN